MNSARGKIVLISAPSGAGKGTIIRNLLRMKPDLVFSVSATTRAPRAGEVEGVSYSFVTRERFSEMIKNDEFLEYAEYVGEYYGTPKIPVFASIEAGRDILLDIEVKGVRQVLNKMPEAITVFIIPPDMEELERRLRGRGTDTEEKLLARLELARQEMEERVSYNYIIVNDSALRAAEELLVIINKTDDCKSR